MNQLGDTTNMPDSEATFQDAYRKHLNWTPSDNTLRDLFAAAVLVGLNEIGDVPHSKIAEACYKQADAMIEARKKGTTDD